ncbi:hypothetical protein ROA7450_03998 [Roseovarius albus]|uniref:DUF937 domain-containing protein n=1 Tax=Roseovarius albus TaxID=1247867 RepID=A0A1X7A9F3_9RHOB|nr:DUF937 domain-containing protein [Roseovarius albus]SLN72161.1 hypothetical protein ROA7450_03998 [Roseovarius albus]
MSLMNLLQQAQGGQGLGQLAQQLGLAQSQADSLTEMLAPAIGSAARKRAESGGLDDILGALRGENQAGMFDDAQTAASQSGQAQGLDFLERLMGGRNEAQDLANEAAQRAGVDQGLVQQFLPALAAMVQGGLQKQMPDSQIDGMIAMQASAQGQGGGLMGMIGNLVGGGNAQQGDVDLSMLTGLLDADGDGSALDDVLGKLMR